VGGEIDALRSKFEGRRKLAPLDEGMEKARNGVVSCLRVNDRKPLDCWREVEAFKTEVARWEEAFVDRVVG
jgi:altered-inheritance-of-mitochondria protein 13